MPPKIGGGLADIRGVMYDGIELGEVGNYSGVITASAPIIDDSAYYRSINSPQIKRGEKIEEIDYDIIMDAIEVLEKKCNQVDNIIMSLRGIAMEFKN